MENTTKSNTNEVFKKPRGKKKLMIEALNNHLGIVTTAAKQVGIDRTTHYRWLKEDPAYNYWSEESNMNMKDFGEQTLMQLLKERNPMITWNFNKTQNRDRGYGEQIGIEHSGEIKVPTGINFILQPDPDYDEEKRRNQPTTPEDQEEAPQMPESDVPEPNQPDSPPQETNK